MRHLLAITALAVCCMPATADVADLIKKLASKDNEVRRLAASELAEAGPDAAKAIKPLIKALKDSDLYVRRSAATALGKIGPAAVESVPALTVMLEETRPAARDAAIRALGAIGPAAVPALTKAVSKGSSPDVQEMAIASLAKAGPTALPALLGVVKEPTIDASLRRKALEGVRAAGPSAANSVVPVLVDVVKMPRAQGREGRQFRTDAVNALGFFAKSSDSSALAVLDGIVKDEKNNDKQLKNLAGKTAKQIRAKK